VASRKGVPGVFFVCGATKGLISARGEESEKKCKGWIENKEVTEPFFVNCEEERVTDNGEDRLMHSARNEGARRREEWGGG
jgi:hypothetical protein